MRTKFHLVKPILAVLFVALSIYGVGVWLNDGWCPWHWDSMARFSFVLTTPILAAIAGLQFMEDW